MNRKHFIFILLILLICSIATVSATEIQTIDADDDSIITQDMDSSSITDIKSDNENEIIKNKYSQNKKEASNTIEVTNDNYDQFFETGSSGKVMTKDTIKSGDIINLQGTFNDTEFIIDKDNLSITSIGKTASLFDCTVYLQGQNNIKNSSISNLTINNTKNACEGIIIDSATGIHVSDNTVYVSGSNGFALTTYSMKNSVIENNYLESFHTQTTLRIYGSDNNNFTNNTVKGYANGIYLCAYDEDASNNNTINKNTVIGKSHSSTCYTIQVMGTGNVIEENTVSGGFRGISSEYSNIIRNNDVDSYMVGIYTGLTSTIENNYVHVSENAIGMLIRGEGSLIKNNMVLTNDTAINIAANDITIIDNTLNSKKYSIYSKDYADEYTGINITNNRIIGQIYNDGTMYICNNTIKKGNATRGGAIYNSGTVTVTDNVVEENTAVNGGIIYNDKGTSVVMNNNFNNNNPASFELRDNGIALVDKGKFIPVNAQVAIYENNVLINQATMTDSIINYTVPEGIHLYTITINNITNNSFKNNNFTQAFGINNSSVSNKKEVIITYNTIPDTKYADNVTITGKFMDINGKFITNSNVKIIINGVKNYAKTDSNGTYKYVFQATTQGLNTVTLGYSGNDKYEAYETSTTFNVVGKMPVVVTYEPIGDVNFGDNVTVTGNFTTTTGKVISNANVKVVVNGVKNYAKTDKNGVYSYTFQATALGVNNVSIGYSGNAKYEAYETATTFNVLGKMPVVVTYEPIGDVNFGDNVTVTGNFTTATGKAVTNANVKVVVNGVKNYAKTDKKGVYSFTFQADTLGVNEVTVGYSGNAKYEAYETATTFNVLGKMPVVVTYEPIGDVNFGENVTITGKFTTTTGKAITNANVKIIINGVKYYAKTDKTGTYVLSVQTTVAGVNTVSIGYSGNAKYEAYETTTTFNVMGKQPVVVTYDPISNVKLGNNVTITGKFTTSTGKAITNANVKIMINGVKYYAKTDRTGSYLLSVKTTKVGVNTVTLGYSGNAKYEAYETSTTFNVTN